MDHMISSCARLLVIVAIAICDEANLAFGYDEADLTIALRYICSKGFALARSPLFSI